MNAAPAADREFMPQVGDDLPPGERREQGCLEFRSFQDVANPGVFYLYKIYADTDAFRVHLATDHVARRWFLHRAGPAQHDRRHSAGPARRVARALKAPG